MLNLFYTESVIKEYDEIMYRTASDVNAGRVKMLDMSEQAASSKRYDYDSDFYLHNFYEYEQGVSEPIVRGRMRANLQFWKDIGAPDDIITTINSGYKIPFISTPGPAKFKNNKSAINNSEFVQDAINDLVSKELIVECDQIPDIVNPLSVSVQSSGKKRLILDLRYINHHVWKQKTKFEDFNVALQYFNQGDFMFSFDLKSGYHHIDIFPDHREFLSFSWNFGDGNVRYFSFQVLPFGLASAPYIFTKCLRPLVKFWRSKGVFMVLFLDDGWGTAPNYFECQKVSQEVRQDVINAGLVPNVEKSVWEPTQVIDWLGLTWNSEIGTLQVIQRRVENTISCIDEVLAGLPDITARTLAKFVGKVISFKPVVGHMVQLRTRFSSMSVCQQNHWDSVFHLTGDNEVIGEIFFWKENIRSLNIRYLFHYSIPQVHVYSDASTTGCGAWANSGMKCRYTWSEAEESRSSTWRELKSVALAIESFDQNLKGKCVKVHSDNKGVEAILKKGSMKRDLQKLSIDIANRCKDLDVVLQVQWVPREHNVEADLISREMDLDDWGVSNEFFHRIDCLWGPHTVDRFADNLNCKISRFNSKYWCPNTSQVDAFSVSWENENNWLVPPIVLICQAIKHVGVSKALATLVVPAWPSSPFWPLLFSRNSVFSRMVVCSKTFQITGNIFVQGRNKNSIFGSKKFRNDVICLRLDGRRLLI